MQQAVNTLVITGRRLTRLNCWNTNPSFAADFADMGHHAAARCTGRPSTWTSPASQPPENREMAQQGRLAGPRGTEQRNHFAMTDADRNVVERPATGKSLGQMVDFDGIRHGSLSLSSSCNNAILGLQYCILLTICNPILTAPHH